MIDNPNDAFAQYEAQAPLRAQLARVVTPLNKAALFAVLQAAGIQRVIVHFDGAGDSGQIESIDATAPDETAVKLPDGTIEIRTPLWDGSGVQTETMSARDTIEKLAYDFLEEVHDGWENEDGAYGEFILDVAELTIRLEYNERVMTTSYSEHEF
jgi:hypothetical protein